MALNLSKSLGFLPLLFIACGGPTDPTASNTDTGSADVAQEQQTVEEDLFEQDDFLLPSTVQVGRMFKRAGLAYVDGVTNPPGNVQSYNGRSVRLLNYGVYSADLSYCVLNNQNQEALNYLKVIEELSGMIGFSEIYAEDGLMERFESSLGDEEMVEEVMVEIQERTDYFIDDNEMQDEAILIYVGGWIEGMYLGVKALGGAESEDISGRLGEQMILLENLLTGMKRSKYSQDVVDLQASLEALNSTYSGLESVTGHEGPGQPQITFADLKLIADQIIEIRYNLIN